MHRNHSPEPLTSILYVSSEFKYMTSHRKVRAPKQHQDGLELARGGARYVDRPGPQGEQGAGPHPCGSSTYENLSCLAARQQQESALCSKTVC